MGGVYDFEANLLNGDPVKLGEYRGKTMFLVNREGKVVERYGSTTKPEQIEADIEAALG